MLNSKIADKSQGESLRGEDEEVVVNIYKRDDPKEQVTDEDPFVGEERQGGAPVAAHQDKGVYLQRDRRGHGADRHRS